MEKIPQIIKGPAIPQSPKIIPINIGPDVCPKNKNIPFIDIYTARCSREDNSATSFWTLGTLIPWAIPKIMNGIKYSQMFGTIRISNKARP